MRKQAVGTPTLHRFGSIPGTELPQPSSPSTSCGSEILCCNSCTCSCAERSSQAPRPSHAPSGAGPSSLHSHNRDVRVCASAVPPVHSSSVFMKRMLEVPALRHVLEVPGVLFLLPVVRPSVSNAPSCGNGLQRIQGTKTTPTPDVSLHIDVQNGPLLDVTA